MDHAGRVLHVRIGGLLVGYGECDWVAGRAVITL
jgi:hypothetical protein